MRKCLTRIPYNGPSLITKPNSMTTLPNAQYVVRRKAYAPHYNTPHLALFQPEIHDTTNKLMDVSHTLFLARHPYSFVTKILGRIAGKTSVDCLDLLRHFMVDVLAQTNFGSVPGALDKWAMNSKDHLSVAVYDFPKRGVLVRSSPYSLHLHKLKPCSCSAVQSPLGHGVSFPSSQTPAFDKSAIRTASWQRSAGPTHLSRSSFLTIFQFVSSKLYDMRAKMQTSKYTGDSDSEKLPLLERLLQHRLFSSDNVMSDQNIISECMGHL